MELLEEADHDHDHDSDRVGAAAAVYVRVYVCAGSATWLTCVTYDIDVAIDMCIGFWRGLLAREFVSPLQLCGFSISLVCNCCFWRGWFGKFSRAVIPHSIYHAN